MGLVGLVSGSRARHYYFFAMDNDTLTSIQLRSLSAEEKQAIYDMVKYYNSKTYSNALRSSVLDFTKFTNRIASLESQVNNLNRQVAEMKMENNKIQAKVKEVFSAELRLSQLKDALRSSLPDS